MYTIKDFCKVLDVSSKTMHRYLSELTPFLRLGGTKKRKRMYTPNEAEIVFEHLKKTRPKRFKVQYEKLEDIFRRTATK